MASAADIYRNTYLDTHMQRFQLSMQLAQQDVAQQFAISQMLAQQIATLDKSIMDIKGAKTTDELSRRIKAANLRQTVVSDAMKRKLRIYNDVEEQFDVSKSLASVNTAADKFGTSLAAAGAITDKARRQAGTVQGYTPGTNQAAAVAATTFSTFKAEAERQGKGTAFKAKEADIKKIIAKRFGIKESQMDTVDAVKEKMINDRLQDEGRQALTEEQLKEIEALAAGNATPEQKQGALDQLLTRRAALSEKQLTALERASLTPEQKMQRAREIYRTQMGPESYKTRGLQEYQSYFNRLPPEMQKITLGYQKIQPDQIDFMKGRRSDIVGDKEKEVAFDLYYTLEKDRRAGKQPAYLVHEKVEQFFPDDEEAQQRVLGYIFRQTEAEKGLAIKMTKARQKDLDEYLIGQYGRTAPSDKEILDDLLAGRIGLVEPPQTDKSDEAPEAVEAAAKTTVVEPPVETQVKVEEVTEATGEPPAAPEQIMSLPIGTEVKKDPNFTYGYRLERIAPNGQLQFSGTGKIEGKKINPAMQAEAEAAYKAALEAAQAQQAAPQE